MKGAQDADFVIEGIVVDLPPSGLSAAPYTTIIPRAYFKSADGSYPTRLTVSGYGTGLCMNPAWYGETAIFLIDRDGEDGYVAHYISVYQSKFNSNSTNILRLIEYFGETPIITTPSADMQSEIANAMLMLDSVDGLTSEERDQLFEQALDAYTRPGAHPTFLLDDLLPDQPEPAELPRLRMVNEALMVENEELKTTYEESMQSRTLMAVIALILLIFSLGIIVYTRRLAARISQPDS